jgi:hypothetical protein
MKKILLTLAIVITGCSGDAQSFFTPSPYANAPQGVGANNILGWGENFDRTIDVRPNPHPTLGTMIINYHTGLTFSAHSFYGGIRFYNQGYPNPYDPATGSTMVMSITNNNVGVGTANPASKLTVNAGEATKSIEISGNNFNGDANTHYFPALSFYATKDGTRPQAASAEIVFSDRPGTLGYAVNSRAADILFYTAHSYDPGSNLYGGYPDLSMVIRSTQDGGYVGIGTTIPDAKLAVNGTIHAKEVKVDLTGWPDYVFNANYNLPALTDVKTYIDQNHHLPDMPSAEEVTKEGINLGEMNKVLTKKVEELILYLIEKDEEIKYQREDNKKLHTAIKELKQQVSTLSDHQPGKRHL